MPGKDMSESIQSAMEYLNKRRGFECRDLIGKGTYGSVIKVFRKDGSEMAAKIVEDRVVNMLEIKEWVKLEHDNVLRLLESILNVDGVVIFLTDLMETNLFLKLQSRDFKKDPQAPERCRSYMRDVLSGLSYMHSLNLCHLDVRAENIFLTKDDRAVVADFSGICKATDTKKHCPLPHSLRPPEMLKDKKRVDPMPVDLWSCGLLMANLYLGKGFYLCTVKHAKAGHLEAVEQYTGLFQCQGYVSKFISETYPNSRVTPNYVSEVTAFIKMFLQFNPYKRMSLSEAVKCKFLAENALTETAECALSVEVNVANLRDINEQKSTEQQGNEDSQKTKLKRSAGKMSVDLINLNKEVVSMKANIWGKYKFRIRRLKKFQFSSPPFIREIAQKWKQREKKAKS